MLIRYSLDEIGHSFTSSGVPVKFIVAKASGLGLEGDVTPEMKKAVSLS